MVVDLAVWHPPNLILYSSSSLGGLSFWSWYRKKGGKKTHPSLSFEVVVMEDEQNDKKNVYHEKQRLQFCLLHALNNLLQDQEKDSFTRQELDMIASKLAVDDPDKHTWTPFFKPHHNTLTGNYDVNVLIAALEARGKTVVWHDHRKGASSIEIGHRKEALVGFMLNVPVRRFGGLWRSRHWIALPRIDGIWYNLDSDLRVPKSFENEEELMAFMDNVIGQGGEVLVVLHNKR